MNAILSKLRANSSTSDSADASKFKKSSSLDSAPEEKILEDEQDSFTGGISGTLAISDETLRSPVDSNKDFSYQVPCDGNYSSSSHVTFEVISAEVIREGRSGHVNYTVLINPHKETLRASQTVIIRRYSDFESLHQQLKKKFPAIMSHISFPRKVLTGNFTSETIAKRSTAFEQYLAHLFSYFDIRYNSIFMEFFVGDDFSNAIESFVNKDFRAAISNFEKTLPALEKLYGDSHPHVFHCLCGLLASYVVTEKYAVAHACAEVALRCSGTADDETMTALLLTAIRLCWSLGKEKQDLEKRLQKMKDKGFDVNSVRDLHNILQDTFCLGKKE